MTRALLITSQGAPAGATVPVLAALEASDLDIRAIDVGRAGARDEGTVGRFVRAIAGEFAERRVVRELDENPPDVVVAFDPVSVHALTEWRDGTGRPAPVLAVVAELDPGAGWAETRADRYLAVDDTACVALSDRGIPGESIISVGPIAPFAFASAGSQSRAELRRRFKLSGHVVVVDVDGLGYERTSQIALQLSLVNAPATYLFDAGDDTDAASALRRQVPTLDMKAKLFGQTGDAPLLWRCADVAIVAPSHARVARAMAVGARVVSFLSGQTGQTLASALAQRGLGRTATSPLLLSSALEPLLADKGAGPQPADGAGNVADIARLVAGERDAIIAESRNAAYQPIRERVEEAAAWAEASTAQARAPGELEDLSGAGSPGPNVPPVGDAEISALKREIQDRITQTNNVVVAAQKAAGEWQKRRELAEKKGKPELARQAEQNAESERSRMHAALAELAKLSSELEALGKAESAPRPRTSRPRDDSSSRRGGTGTSTRAPRSDKKGVDELLEEMKRHQPSGGSTGSSSAGRKKRRATAPRSRVDDELAALKRKMAEKGKKK